MAKVKITGHASGTGVITVTAPNTSTDRTITLPDATATIATTTDVAARLPSITDGGNATAITITSAERVGIGEASPDATLEVQNNTSDYVAHFGSRSNATGDNVLALTTYNENPAHTSYLIRCTSNTADAGAGTDRFAVMGDGRGLSQFTAKAWANMTGMGTPYFRDSHNCSSLTDVATGVYTINFANNLANTNYCPSTANAAESANGEMINTWTRLVGSFKFENVDEGGTKYDSSQLFVTIFGD